MYKNLKYLFISSLFFVACSEDIKEEVIAEAPLSKGSADFTKYVALGNSLTAGFSDGALFKAGQINAYPNLMAEKFAEVGGGPFTTPLTNDNVGGLLVGGVQIQGPRLVFFNGAPVPLNIAVPGSVPTTEIGVPLTGTFNNLGVPGAKSYHLVAPNYGNIAGLSNGTANPYFVRFRSSASTTILNDALTQNPTFFSLWIGNNDVLGYATSGGTGVNQLGNTNPATYAGNDISDPAMFNSVYNQMIDALTAGGRKGVVANIPSVTSAAFFKAVPFNPITAASLGAGLLPNGTVDQQIAAGTAAMNQLNSQLLDPLDQILTALGQPNRFQLLNTSGSNPLLVVDEGLTNLGPQIQAIAASSGNPQLVALAPFLGSVYGQARHATKDDLVLLTTRSVIGQPAGSPVPSLNAFGVSFPLQDQHVLVPNEITMINTATTAFNNTIKTAAESKGLAFVDVNSIMSELSRTGIRFDNYHMSATFGQGGVFSWDGIHITARANAYIANQFLEAIEKTYGAKFNKFKPQDKPITYPSFLPN
jgi:lysophospholipase L1-like esterase